MQFIDEKQGLDEFFKRYCRVRGFNARVREAHRRISIGNRMRVANILVKSGYEEARKVPELEEEIFSKAERYIRIHPEIFNSPYQLGFRSMRYI